MLGHMIGQIKTKTGATVNVGTDFATNHDLCREQAVAAINDLHALSRRGLWGILLFLSISAAILYGSVSGLFSSLPVEVKELFGEAPPLEMLHLVLAVSWLSALVLILGKRGRDGKPAYHWCNIGLPTAFYPLYLLSEPSGTHFSAVFAAGLLLLVIEHVTVSCYVSRAIREERERLQYLAQRS